MKCQKFLILIQRQNGKDYVRGEIFFLASMATTSNPLIPFWKRGRIAWVIGLFEFKLVETQHLFEIESKLGKLIRITVEHWDYIRNVKHPEVNGLENEIKETLINPIEIKKSSSDENVFLYYSNYKTNYLCIVARHLNEDGFIITM